MTSIRTATATATALIGTTLVGIALAGPAAAAEGEGWKTLGGVSMQRACDNQYPGQARTAVVLNASDAYSWACRRIQHDGAGRTIGVQLGGISVERQCVVQYGGYAKATAQEPSNPYSWICRRWVIN